MCKAFIDRLYPFVINFIGNNVNAAGVYPEDNYELDENDALISTYNSDHSYGSGYYDSDSFIFQYNDEYGYFKSGAFEDFVTQTEDPDFMPDITGGADFFILTMI